MDAQRGVILAVVSGCNSERYSLFDKQSSLERYDMFNIFHAFRYWVVSMKGMSSLAPIGALAVFIVV